MKKFMTNILENSFWFNIIYLAFVLIEFNSLAAHTTGLTVVSYPLVLLGACVLFYRVFHFKEYIGTRGVWFLMLFVISYCISSLLTREYGILENVQALAWMVIQFFVLYVYDRRKSVEKDKREVWTICWIFVVYNFFMAIVALVMFFLDYRSFSLRNEVYVNAGLCWGRLYGLYSEINYGAVLSLVSLVMAVGLWKRASKALRPFLAVHIVLQLIYIALTDSRTAMVSMAATAAVAIFLIYIRIGKPVNKSALRYVLAVVLAVVVAAASVVAFEGIQSAGNQIKLIQNEAKEKAESESEQDEEQTADDEDKSEQDEEQTTNNANKSKKSQKKVTDDGDRSEEFQEANSKLASQSTNEKVIGHPQIADISNQRFDIWKSGLELWSTSPIFGISFRNYVPYAKANLPDTYIINNDTLIYTNLHNMFMDILVSQGLVGIVLFLCFVVSVFILFFRRYFKAKDENYWYYTFLGVCILPFAVAVMFMSDILYENSPGAVLFWMLLGYLIHAVACDAKQEIPQPALEEG